MDPEQIYYKSTRSNDAGITSAQAIVKGMAPDGGLYVPEAMPSLDMPVCCYSGMDYPELAYKIMSRFLTDFTEDELRQCIMKAYDEKFDTPLVAPVVKAHDVFFLELFHGATCAFKDMALSLLPHLLTLAVQKAGTNRETVILTATSGDTGKAALESFSNVPGTKIIVFYPSKGVSLVQERQMITQEGANTFVCAIEGNFDDAQTGVKEIFGDMDLNKKLDANNMMFSSANSINIGRLIPQVAYYFNAYIRLLEKGEIAENEEINIVVPTGNFGNILAAYYAKTMGLPVNKLICASNENNVLYDFINTGVYNRMRELKLTMSPSMDILISSNLERLIYELCDRDPVKLSGLFSELANKGVFEIDEEMKEKLSDFWGGYATEKQTLNAISEVYRNHNYLIDTHTAVAYYVYREYAESTSDRTKTVIAATASPFKFPGSVIKAISNNPSEYSGLDEFGLLEKLSLLTGIEVPAPLRGIGSKKILHNNYCTIDSMKDFVTRSLGI